MTGIGTQGETQDAIRMMEYPVLSRGPGEPDSPEAGPETDRERAFARQLEAVRREAQEQGRQMGARESGAWRQQCAAELAKAMTSFLAGRDAYLAQVEKEVVRLALAIAERILHREAQTDPLLLSNAVRQALGQLADATEVRLHVASEQQELWKEVLRYMPGLPLHPQIVADADLPGCSVQLESTLGAVDLSIRAQLEEIERGFFDRTEGHAEGGPAASGEMRKRG